MLVETSRGRMGRDEPEGPRRRAIKKDTGRHARAGVARRRRRPADEKKPDAKPPRLVVIGNSRFATNGALANGANGMLFANAVHWLAGSEKQVGIAPKTPEQTSLSLTDAQVNRLAWAAVAGLPAWPSCSASGSGTGAATDPAAMTPKKLLVLSAVVVAALRVHPPLRAQDADDRGAAAQGRALLGPPAGAGREARAVAGRRRPSSSSERATRLADGQARDVSRPTRSRSGASSRSSPRLRRAGGEDRPRRKPADYGLDQPVAKATIVWSEADDAKNAEDPHGRVRDRDPGNGRRRRARRGHREGALRAGVAS